MDRRGAEGKFLIGLIESPKEECEPDSFAERQPNRGLLLLRASARVFVGLYVENRAVRVSVAKKEKYVFLSEVWRLVRQSFGWEFVQF